MLISASMVLTPTLIYFFRTNFVFLSPSERGLGTKKNSGINNVSEISLSHKSYIPGTSFAEEKKENGMISVLYSYLWL